MAWVRRSDGCRLYHSERADAADRAVLGFLREVDAG